MMITNEPRIRWIFYLEIPNIIVVVVVDYAVHTHTHTHTHIHLFFGLAITTNCFFSLCFFSSGYKSNWIRNQKIKGEKKIFFFECLSVCHCGVVVVCVYFFLRKRGQIQKKTDRNITNKQKKTTRFFSGCSSTVSVVSLQTQSVINLTYFLCFPNQRGGFLNNEIWA